MQLFNAIGEGLSRAPSSLARYSLDAIADRITAERLKRSVIYTLRTQEASYLALRVRDWTLRSQYEDMSMDALLERVAQDHASEEIINTVIFILEKYYQIGMLVSHGDVVYRPTASNELELRLRWDGRADGFGVVPETIDGTEATCYTPREASSLNCSPENDGPVEHLQELVRIGIGR